ncbi:MAG: outer membrane protein [Pseudorhodoplanes sp.]|uniref:outer membrane protein n=1 Tax=Pseudorhodoplanes sp. TaxID=1934341 RepID=UPI003D0DD338
MRKIAIALLSTTALFGISAQPASAADIARPVYKAPPPVVAMYNWTGFYAGGNIGWGWSSGDGDIIINGAAGTFSGSGDGFFGGVQAGYNWQNGPWVVGIETDFQASAGNGSISGFAGGNTLTASGDSPWFGTIRGRLGVAQDRALWYVTGGALYSKSEYDGIVTGFGPFSGSDTTWTWTVGGGLEWALFDRWTAKIEYLYAGPSSSVPSIPATRVTDGWADTHIIRTGLNFRF